MLGRQWVAEESQPGYVPPSASWPPPEEQPRRSYIPVLKKALAQCGGTESDACHGVAFALSVALIGGSLFGHSEHDDTERTDDERTIGADLMHTLAERGSPAGMCGWAYCLIDGDLTVQDVPRAVALHHEAARGGYAQSMHELGVLYFTGEWSDEGVDADHMRARHWLRAAAERGVAPSMYLLGELLLEQGAAAEEEAYRWFAHAGERGHRGARARILEKLDADHNREYGHVSGRKASQWTAS